MIFTTIIMTIRFAPASFSRLLQLQGLLIEWESILGAKMRQRNSFNPEKVQTRKYNNNNNQFNQKSRHSFFLFSSAINMYARHCFNKKKEEKSVTCLKRQVRKNTPKRSKGHPDYPVQAVIPIERSGKKTFHSSSLTWYRAWWMFSQVHLAGSRGT